MNLKDSPLIHLHHATVQRGNNVVLHDLSLEIAVGCSTVILGPNGSGKSTFLKVLTRELYPLAGPGSFVRLMGQEQWNVWALRSRLGIISAEMPQTFSARTPGMDILLSGFFSSVDLYAHQTVTRGQRARGEEILHELGVAHLHDRPFGDMSVGEQRRVILGRALVHEPHALVLDEPTTGLDVQACFHYLTIIRNFIRKGGTVILVTHHVHEIPPEVKRVVFLKQGRIRGDGPTKDLVGSSSLSQLFDASVHVIDRGGWNFLVPALDGTPDDAHEKIALEADKLLPVQEFGNG